MKQILSQLTSHQTWSRQQAREVLINLAAGKYNPSQMSAFLTVFLMRDISLEELSGFREAMLELCVPVKFDQPVMDVCGTGGDSKNTFNISTLSAFVVAAAGQPVAKHGNYGVSSVSGSSNVMESLGFRFQASTDVLRRCMDECGIAFLHAPLFHPAMKNIAPIRKELGVKTFFNMLGPMVNPAFPSRQLVGVFSLELARLYGYLYQGLDKSYVIMHDIGGYDEVSLTGPVKIYANGGEDVLSPEDFGLTVLQASDIAGGATVEEAARIFLDILEGRGTQAQQDVVAANSAVALLAASQLDPKPFQLKEAVEKSREVLRSGKAAEVFRKLVAISQSV